MISYLKSVIAADSPASTHRFVAVVAVICLGLSTVILAVAACFHVDVAAALGATTVPLAGMAGYQYGKGKAVEAAAAASAPPA